MINLPNLKKSVLVLDLETSAFWSDGKPVDINTNFDEYVKRGWPKWFGAYSYKHDKVYLDQVKGNEQKIRDLIEEHNVVCGFNNIEFDTPILYNRNLMPQNKRILQVDCMQILGATSFYNRSGASFKNRGQLMGYKMKRNSLKAMAQAMGLPTQKGDIDYKIFQKDGWTPEEKAEIKVYLKADVMATKQMFDKLWDFWKIYSDWISPFNVRNLSWIRSSIASLTYKAACHTLKVEETYGEKVEGKEEMGGRVIEPKYEEARNVWYADFTALYAHLMAMFNLFAELDARVAGMFRDKTGYMGQEFQRKMIFGGNEMFKVKGYYDISGQHPLSKDVAEKIAKRIHLKKTDPKNPMVYALKIFLNSLYGAARSPVFEQIHTSNLGWDCAWLGQQMQEYLEKRMKDFGFETIAGDTDSIFIRLKNPVERLLDFSIENPGLMSNEKTYVQYCLNTIVEEIKAHSPFPCDTFGIDIEHGQALDYVMWPFSEQPIKGPDGKNLKNEKGRLIKEWQPKKKNYVYIVGGKLHIKGLPIIKDNATKLGVKILNDSLRDKIVSQGSAKFSKEFLSLVLQNALADPENLKLLAVEYKVKPAIAYKKESQIQAQISVGYFNGGAGVISLIKNKKVGKAGKGSKYATVQEILDAGLGIDELDLTKLRNELSPFVRRD